MSEQENSPIDKTKLKPAEENPWYVLATIYGEEPDNKTHIKNRMVWNSWAVSKLNEEQKQVIAKKRLGILDNVPNWDDIHQEVAKRFEKRLAGRKLPNPCTEIDFSFTCFVRRICFRVFIFPLGIDFSQSIFTEGADLRKGIFLAGANFGRTIFADKTLFNNAMFFDYALFKKAVFQGHPLFKGTTFFSRDKSVVFIESAFNVGAVFRETTFHGDATFRGADFFDYTSFHNATFFGSANFSRADFYEHAPFSKVTFSGSANFRETTFSKIATFPKTTFNALASFKNTTFEGHSYFRDTEFMIESIFTDCQFNEPCNLSSTKFKTVYPILEGTKLHEKTILVTNPNDWPDPKNYKQNPKQARASCEVLRHSMNNQGLPEQAHFFFRREMAFAGRMGSLGQRLPYKLFGWLSDYGYSIYRPALWLIALWLGFASVYKVFSSLSFTESLGLSIASLLQFTGWQRVYFSEVMADLPVWLKILAGFQTIAGIVLLFLLGLGLRNRFRFK